MFSSALNRETWTGLTLIMKPEFSGISGRNFPASTLISQASTPSHPGCTLLAPPKLAHSVLVLGSVVRVYLLYEFLNRVMDERDMKPILSERIFCFLSCFNKHGWAQWGCTSGASQRGCSELSLGFRCHRAPKLPEKIKPLQQKTWKTAVSWEQRQSQPALGCSTLKVTPVHSDLAPP